MPAGASSREASLPKRQEFRPEPNAEDEQFGDARGDELPARLSTHQGRRGWLRDAKRRLDEKRAAEARPIPSSRPERLHEAKRRLEEEHATDCHANVDYEAYRAG